MAILQAFVDTRRGLRLGSFMGAPAVFVGRRLAIRLRGDDIDVRLAPAGHDLAHALLRTRVRTSAPPGWLRLSPPGTGDSIAGYLTVFEYAVRDVATA